MVISVAVVPLEVDRECEEIDPLDSADLGSLPQHFLYLCLEPQGQGAPRGIGLLLHSDSGVTTRVLD